MCLKVVAFLNQVPLGRWRHNKSLYLLACKYIYIDLNLSKQCQACLVWFDISSQISQFWPTSKTLKKHALQLCAVHASVIAALFYKGKGLWQHCLQEPCCPYLKLLRGLSCFYRRCQFHPRTPK